jgi:hypothetical protein
MAGATLEKRKKDEHTASRPMREAIAEERKVAAIAIVEMRRQLKAVTLNDRLVLSGPKGLGIMRADSGGRGEWLSLVKLTEAQQPCLELKPRLSVSPCGIWTKLADAAT